MQPNPHKKDKRSLKDQKSPPLLSKFSLEGNLSYKICYEDTNILGGSQLSEIRGIVKFLSIRYVKEPTN